MHDALRIVGYGLLAALSPTALLATLVVLGSGRGRANGVVFAAAFVLGQSVAFLVAFAIGSAATPRSESPVVPLLELAVGLALLSVGWARRSPREPRVPKAVPRSEALFARLSQVRPSVSFGIGLPLGVGAKRLIVTILAATTLALSGLDPPEEVALGVTYVLIATLVVWVPVAVYVVFGSRADATMARTRRWIATHEDWLTSVCALVLGALFVADAVVGLVT